MSELYCPACSKQYDTPDGRCPVCMKPLGAAIPGTLKTTIQQPVISRQNEDTTTDDTLIQSRRAAETFRPRFRPPMLVLHVWDDDGADCEVIRLYGERFVIGRTEGDLVIPHDPGISRQHVELVRERGAGRWIWTLRDLQSSHGTFVRIQELALNHGQILLMGCGRYQFKGVAAGRGTDRSGRQIHPDHYGDPCLPTADAGPV